MDIEQNQEAHGWLDNARSFIADRRVLAIVDPAVERANGISEQLDQPNVSSSLTCFTQFSPNPSWDSLQDALKKVQDKTPDTVIAVGGGTAIDLAKLASTALDLGGADQLWAASQTNPIALDQRHTVRLMAVPTTAGTGAEATQFAVIYRDNLKYSIAGAGLMPDQVALDPALLASLPPTVIADAGLDAACQAMESLWSVRSSPASETDAWAALRLAVTHLAPAVQTQDQRNLRAMLEAAHRAGKAINLTTTTAPHALSYSLTTCYGIPHGRAVARLFGPIFSKLSRSSEEDCRHPKGHSFLLTRLQHIADAWGQTPDGFPSWWASYLEEKLSIPNDKYELPSSQLDQLVQTVNAKRLANSPVQFSQSQIEGIYRETIES